MKNLNKLLKKMDEVLKRITADEIIQRLENQSNIETDIELYHEYVINDIYSEKNNKYIKKIKIKYNDLELYNNYEEGDIWTSTKAS